MDDPTNPDGLTDLQMLTFYQQLLHGLHGMADDIVAGPDDDAVADNVYEIVNEMGATARRMRDYYLRRIALGAEPWQAVRPER